MNETQSEGHPAVGILVMAFTDETAADEVLQELKEAKKQKQFFFEDAADVEQDTQGKVRYHETGDIRTGKGVGIGALVGGVPRGPVGLQEPGSSQGPPAATEVAGCAGGARAPSGPPKCERG